MRSILIKHGKKYFGEEQFSENDIKSLKAECGNCSYWGGPLILTSTNAQRPLNLYCVNCAETYVRNEPLRVLISRFPTNETES